MYKNEILQEIKKIYDSGSNIMQYLRGGDFDDKNTNTTEDIMISYDFQAGSYTRAYYDNPQIYERVISEVAAVIDNLDGNKRSIMEAGMGEGQAIYTLVRKLKNPPKYWGGIDISWSRIKVAQKFFIDQNCEFAIKRCAMGDMFSLPFADNSVDIVFTCHSIEPNTGHEKEILSELYRVANEYLVLKEPAYDMADAEQKKRMEKMGYIRNLYGAARELGYNIVEWKLSENWFNPMNPSGIMVIKKDNKMSENGVWGGDIWADPITHTILSEIGNVYYSRKSLLAYPVLNGVPCLLKEYAVVATHLLDFCS